MKRITTLLIALVAIVAVAGLVPATAGAKPVKPGPAADVHASATEAADPSWPAVAFAVGFPVVVVAGGALLARRWSREAALRTVARPQPAA